MSMHGQDGDLITALSPPDSSRLEDENQNTRPLIRLILA